MTARPPPARPHVGIHTSSHFGYPGRHDWAEDDVWDSGSDSDSPRQSSLTAPSWNPSNSLTMPKPVPKPVRNSSSSTLAFSYTHISAPNPSSSFPKEDPVVTEKGGWTLVKKLSGEDASHPSAPRDLASEQGLYPVQQEEPDADVEGTMILGEIETEVCDPPVPLSMTKCSYNKASVREDVEEVVHDPLNGFRKAASFCKSPIQRQPSNLERSEKLLRERSIRSNRRHKFVDCLSGQDINVAELRKLAWAGIPADLRPMAWQLLLGYLPFPTHLRASTLARKRSEYLSLVEVAFARDRLDLDQQIWHQIEIDVPRTRPGVTLWMHEATQRSLERILYVWAIRHPASGYVQGINDLVTPFFQVFMSAYIDSDPENFDPSLLPTEVLNAIEADSFWCLSRLLDGIQDNYISGQPGIQRSVRRMAELVARIDAPLFAHLHSQNVEFMQFAFRWMNCLLMREISVQNTIRMWDTYLAEGSDAFSQFHLYVCSAFLVKWSDKLREMDFQGIIMFLQSLPTQDWGDHEIEMLLSEAFVLNSIWQNAQSHFNAT